MGSDIKHSLSSNILRSELRLVSLFLALIIYALWGSPTPDKPSIIELLVGVSVVGAIGLASFPKSVLFLKNQTNFRWELSGKLLLIYGLVVPVVIALLKDVELTHIIRDLIGFFFLCLPLFFTSLMTKHRNDEQVYKTLLNGVIIIGITFPLRVLFPNFVIFNQSGELLYLANSPLVLFTALLFLGYGLYFIYTGLSIKNMTQSLLAFFVVFITCSAMFVDVQRATFGAVIVSVVILGLIGFVKSPLKVIIPSIIIITLGTVLSGYWVGLSADMAQKTSMVGLNMRFHEVQAIWNAMGSDVLNILFGLGWGAQYNSPAVGGLNVTFSHSLLSYMFLKTGLVGLSITLVYLFFVFEKSARLYLIDPVKGNAVIWALIIPIMLYASYKSFDFGLLLVLIILLAKKREPLLDE